MRRLPWTPLLLAAVVVACLRPNDEFVEPAALWEDCSVSPDACQEGLVCAEFSDRTDGAAGYACVPQDCDDATDCPPPDSGSAEPICFKNGGRCGLSCTPRHCAIPGSGCNTCPAGLSCAPDCGDGPTPETNTHCVACPEGMECFPGGESMDGQILYICGHR